MLCLLSHDIYYLLDLDSTIFYVTPYVVEHFGFCLKNISNPFLMFILHRKTLVDLIELVMVDFDMILRMYWLHLCYASMDCRT